MIDNDDSCLYAGYENREVYFERFLEAFQTSVKNGARCDSENLSILVQREMGLVSKPALEVAA
jgi:hypothetical protein